MKDKFLSKKNFLFNCFIIVIFFLGTALIVIPSLKTGRVFAQSDWLFHSSRVEQIYLNLKHGSVFTFLATNTFQQSGVANFLFYPTLFLYPWALLRFVFTPITSFYVWYAMLTFLAFLISYFSMHKLTKDPVVSTVFSFLYVFSAYRLYLGTLVFGEFIAATFIPLAFIGLYEVLWGDDKDWMLLSIGLSLLAYSHLLSTFLTLEFFVILFLGKLIFNQGISASRLKSLLKASLLTILLVLGEVVPFISDFVGHNVSSAREGLALVSDMTTLISQSLNNQAVNTSLGLVLLIVLFFGWFWIRDNKVGKATYILGITAVILATSVFPWDGLKNTIFSVIQLPFRYLLYASFFLAIVGAFAFSKNKFFQEANNFGRYGVLFLVLIFFVFDFYSENRTRFQYISGYNVSQDLKRAPTGKLRGLPESQLTDQNYAYQFDYLVPYGEHDYFPKKAAVNDSVVNSIINNIAFINKKAQKIKPIGTPNKLTFDLTLHNKSTIDLPVVAYQHTTVTINGKQTHFSHSGRGTVFLKLAPGAYKISVGYQPIKGYYLLVAISSLVFLVSLFTLIWSLSTKTTQRKKGPNTDNLKDKN